MIAGSSQSYGRGSAGRLVRIGVGEAREARMGLDQSGAWEGEEGMDGKMSRRPGIQAAVTGCPRGWGGIPGSEGV